MREKREKCDLKMKAVFGSRENERKRREKRKKCDLKMKVAGNFIK